MLPLPATTASAAWSLISRLVPLSTSRGSPSVCRNQIRGLGPSIGSTHAHVRTLLGISADFLHASEFKQSTFRRSPNGWMLRRREPDTNGPCVLGDLDVEWKRRTIFMPLHRATTLLSNVCDRNDIRIRQSRCRSHLQFQAFTMTLPVDYCRLRLAPHAVRIDPWSS